MSSRDRYECNIVCDKCGEKGTVEISEDDYQFTKDFHRRIENVVGLFSVTLDTKGDILVACKKCLCPARVI